MPGKGQYWDELSNQILNVLCQRTDLKNFVLYNSIGHCRECMKTTKPKSGREKVGVLYNAEQA